MFLMAGIARAAQEHPEVEGIKMTKTAQGKGHSRLAWLVLIAGLVLTAASWRMAAQREEEDSRRIFTIHMNDTLQIVRQRFDVYVNFLYGARGLFAASERVTRQEWKNYASTLTLEKRYPGIVSFGFIRHVSHADKARFERSVRDEAARRGRPWPDFAITPAGVRDEYFPVDFIEPDDPHGNLMGFDRGVDPDTRHILEFSRDSGNAAMSGRLRGPQEADSRPNLIIVLPVYQGGEPPTSVAERRRLLEGFVAVRINVDEMFRGLLGAGILSELFFELYDGGAVAAKPNSPSRDNLLHAVAGEVDLRGATPHNTLKIQQRENIELAGRNWVFFFGREAGQSDPGSRVEWLVLTGGLMVTMLVYALVLVLVHQRRSVMDEVTRQESLFSQVLDALPVNVLLKDSEGRLTLVNDETLRTLGLTKEQVLGKTDFDLFPEDVAQTLRDYDDAVRAQGGLVVREEKLLRNGVEKTLLAGKKMIHLPDSGEPMLLGFSFDIGEMKNIERELEQQRRFIQQVVDTDPNLIFVKDGEGRFVLVNKAVEDLFGIPREWLIRRRDIEVHLHDEETAVFEQIDQEVLRTGEEVVLNESFTRPNGEVRWLQTVKRPLPQPDGKVHVLGISVDITEQKLSMDALRNSELRLRAILDNTNYSIISTEVGGTIRTFNRAAERMLGYTAAEVVGKHTPALIHDVGEVTERAAELSRELGREISPGFQVMTAKASQSEADEREWTYIRKDGSRFPVLLSITALRDRRDRINGYIGIATDITERKMLAQAITMARANELSRSVINALGEGVIGVDNDLAITFVNPEAEKMLGWRENELIGRTVCDVVHGCCEGEDGERDPQKCPLRTVQLNGRAMQMDEARFVNAFGMTFPVSMVASAIIENKKVNGVALSFQDITQRKLAEEDLNHHMAELARMNAELDEFTHVASHDLQEPVRKLIAFSDLLRKDLGEVLPPRAEKDVEFIVDAATRMQRLIRDLLSLSRAGKFSMVREVVKLDEIVATALESLEMRIRESGATIHCAPLPEVTGDATLLAQLYQNLIGNALKFVNNHPPEIHITVEQINGETVFGVRDNGIGINPQYAAQIFQPFKRLHGRAQYEGSGIGLAICRKVVERHRGALWVESEEGQGAYFRFTLGNARGNE